MFTDLGLSVEEYPKVPTTWLVPSLLNHSPIWRLFWVLSLESFLLLRHVSEVIFVPKRGMLTVDIIAGSEWYHSIP